MPYFLARIGLTARASYLHSQCWSNTASSPSSLVRVFHSSQLWCSDAAARNARNRERYANDPEYRQRMLQNNKIYAARRRPAHVQKYLKDPEYREMMNERDRVLELRRDPKVKRQRAVRLKENRNNLHQKHAFLNWFLPSKWARRLVWETHDPVVTEGDGLPALCASCGGAYTRRLWWRRKIADESTGDHLLDCHSCFCDKDWEKALPLGYRGHVFGSYARLKEPDWSNYPPSGLSP